MDEIKAYTIKDLAKKEKCTPPTIYKYMNKYIGIQFENARAKRGVKEGTQEHPYSIRYIRVKDIEKIIEKRGGKIIFENVKSGWQKLG